MSCAFPTWWGCWSAWCSRRRSGWSGRTWGVRVPWRLWRRSCSIDSMTIRYDNPLLWVAGGRCVSAWPENQNIYSNNSSSVQWLVSISKHTNLRDMLLSYQTPDQRFARKKDCIFSLRTFFKLTKILAQIKFMFIKWKCTKPVASVSILSCISIWNSS